MDTETVEDLFATSQPDATIQDVVHLPGGFKQVFRIDTVENTYGFYTAETPVKKRKLRIGAAMLSLLDEQEVSIPYQTVVAADFSDTKHPPFYVVDWIEGTPFDKVCEESPDRIAAGSEAAGRVLGQLHQDTSFNTFGELNSDDGETIVWDQEYTDSMSWVEHHLSQRVQQLTGTPFESIVKDVEPRIREHFNKLPSRDTAVLHHNDYTADNLIVNASNEVQAVIDWDWCYTTPQLFSYIYGLEAFGYYFNAVDHDQYATAFRNGYTEATSLPDHTQQEKAVYRVLWQIGQMHVSAFNKDSFAADTVETHCAELRQRANQL